MSNVPTTSRVVGTIPLTLCDLQPTTVLHSEPKESSNNGVRLTFSRLLECDVLFTSRLLRAFTVLRCSLLGICLFTCSFLRKEAEHPS
jgi:hypothetical protein